MHFARPFPRLQTALLALGFVVLLAATSAQAVEVVEYYHPALDHFFITSSTDEKQILDTGGHAGWVRTGQTFQVFNAGDGRLANSVPVCRFYGNPARGLDSHFYSATPQECIDVPRRFPDAWLLEAAEVFRVHSVTAALTCPANTLPIYRLFNGRSDVNHRYAADVAVVDAMLARGFTIEGIGAPRPIAFCAANIAAPASLPGAPECTVAYSTLFPVIGVPVTMTASCSGSPTSYAWINCSGSGPTCTVNSAVAGPVVYGIVASNAQGAGLPVKTTLDWQPLATAAPSCTVSASTTTPVVGGALLLSAKCTENPVRLEWLRCSPLTPDACSVVPECVNATTACSPTSQQQGGVLYAVRGTNNAGTGPKASVSVSWTAAAPPPQNPSAVPSCSLVASSAFPAINSTLTLTATCSNAPTVFEWVGCPSETNVCTRVESTVGPRSYTIYARNSSGVSSPATVSVTWQVPPTEPPVCTLSADTQSPYVGGTAVLTASCTQSPKSYNWVNCSNVKGGTCVAVSSQTGSVTYGVTATNEVGASTPTSISLDWVEPPPTGADFCGNFANVKRVDLTWGGQFTSNHPDGGFEDDQILVGRLSVPANATGTSIPGLISAVEFIDGPANRTMSLSPSACDFRGFQAGVLPTPDPTGALRPMAWSFGINPTMQIALSSMPGNQPKLVPGQTYYVNIRNRRFSDDVLTCAQPECNMRITVNTPR